MCIRDRDMVMNDLRAHFRPEFLNRIDEIIMFKPLNKDNLSYIVDLLIGGVNKMLEDKEVSIRLTDAAKTFVIDNGYDPNFGARDVYKRQGICRS